jgi:uncharacterized protein YdhG (YjbR/CyaY superfamily)
MAGKPTSTEEYLATLTGDQRAVVEKMRETIAGAAPGATAVFSYGIPGFKLDGKALVWVAAWKEHFGLYPLTAAMVDAAGAALDRYELSKGTVRFPASEGVPYALVKKLVKARVAELKREKRSGQP